jgi:sugar/nucleoside kinase (ribokinase family)
MQGFEFHKTSIRNPGIEKMPLLALGTLALDSIETQDQTRQDMLGGSAVYFAYAASYFTPVHLVGVVGEDWPDEHTALLRQRGIDVDGLHVMKGEKTFRWRARYTPELDQRETLDVQLNAYGAYRPTLPEHLRRSPFLFLANGSPTVQLEALDQMIGPRLVIAEAIEMWIRDSREQIQQLLRRVGGFVLSASEARQLTGEANLVRAGTMIREMGPMFVVIKKAEHGAMFFSKHETYVLPAYPTPDVVDPTGAGDSFAGGMMGYLTQQGDFEPKTLKEAMAYGILVASYTVEDFSLDRLRSIELDDIQLRMERYRRMLSF